MNNEFKKIEEELEKIGQTVSLSTMEKEVHREALKSFVKTGPVFSPFMQMIRYSAAFAIAVIIVGGGGTSTLAALSLPGTPLYTLKLTILEPIRGTLAVSLDQKADLEIEFVNDRLEEYAEISTRTGVSEETSTLVLASLTNHVNRAQGAIEKLEEEGNTEGAFRANAKFQSLLEVHADVLVSLESNQADTQEQTASITSHVDESLRAVNVVSASLADSLMLASTTSNIKETLEDEQEEIENSLSDLQKQIQKGGVFLDMEDREVLESAIEEVEATLTKAESEEENPSEAFILYIEANQQITALRAIIDAEETTGIDLIRKGD